MKLLFDEGLSPKLISLLCDLFPESESALTNGLARTGDLIILQYATANKLVLVSTDRDFEGLQQQVANFKVVILHKCDYPTEIAADLLRRNAVRITSLLNSKNELLILHRKDAKVRYVEPFGQKRQLAGY